MKGKRRRGSTALALAGCQGYMIDQVGRKSNRVKIPDEIGEITQVRIKSFKR